MYQACCADLRLLAGMEMRGSDAKHFCGLLAL